MVDKLHLPGVKKGIGIKSFSTQEREVPNIESFQRKSKHFRLCPSRFFFEKSSGTFLHLITDEEGHSPKH